MATPLSAHVLSVPQNNGWFVGLSALLLITGGRFISDDINFYFGEKLSGSALFRYCIIFAIIFLNTKNVGLAMICGIVYALTYLSWHKKRRQMTHSTNGHR